LSGNLAKDNSDRISLVQVPNGTGLSTFAITSAVLDFDELGSMFGEELIGFRSSFDGSGLAAEGAAVDAFGGANADDL